MFITPKVRTALGAVVVGSCVLMAGCAASERQRAISAGPVDSGPGTVGAVRAQLAGTWTLTRFEVLNAAGQLTPVRAKAQLTYDAFGNLSIKGVLEEPLPGQTTVTEAPALMYTGRAAIDAPKQELVFMGTESTVEPDPSILAKIALDARRKFTVSDTELVVSAMDAQGKITSRATYRKG
jgi:hypothetical protein